MKENTIFIACLTHTKNLGLRISETNLEILVIFFWIYLFYSAKFYAFNNVGNLFVLLENEFARSTYFSH